MADLLYWLDLVGVAVFAASGALVASRKQLDVIGFALIGAVTGIGGGTLRDLLLGRPVFWIGQPEYVLLCFVVATVVFFVSPHIGRRYPVLLWADAAGLSVFAVAGTRIAVDAGVAWPVAILMGMMTATFGGLLRDVLCNEIPLVLRKEIYATAAALGSGIDLLLVEGGAPPPVPALGGFAACFVLRALAIRRGWSLPAYRPRPGRDYPLE